MTKELRQCASANILLGLITREQEAALTDRRAAILKINGGLKDMNVNGIGQSYYQNNVATTKNTWEL